MDCIETLLIGASILVYPHSSCTHIYIMYSLSPHSHPEDEKVA